jgi:hypothetical protein
MAVQNSQLASMIPSEISLPLKTTISSRMRTIWPMTALNPMRATAPLIARGACVAPDAVTDCTDIATEQN